MRLADFILANVEPILADWERFARGIWPGPATDPATLRDHAEAILRAAVPDMKSAQSVVEQSSKSKGGGDSTDHTDGGHSHCVDTASIQHAADRVANGFELGALVAEYRALRASVLRLWRESAPAADLRDLEDVTRFNEAVDQSLTEAVAGFAKAVEHNLRALAEEKAARAGAENANQAKDTFLAILSHELRTPLNAIVGWVGILRAAGATEADMAEGLDVIERNTKAQTQLIEDILDVSRIVSGKMHLDLRPCDLAEVVAAGVAATRAPAEARGVTVGVNLDRSAYRGSCDAARMQQVVWNLVCNAVKFTPRGGRVDVELGRDPAGGVRLEVRDTGDGIDGDFMPYLFDRFRQRDGSSRRKAGGLGLGLSIVKHIVEAHGGTVQAWSAGVGRGATFTIRLPVTVVQAAAGGGTGTASRPAMVADAASGETRFPPVRLDGLRLLIVDDEPDARRVLAKTLGGMGAIVVAAGSAAEALAVLPAARPQVLVSDLGMPEMDGFDLIREVRARGYHARDLPAVALTGFVEKANQRQALLAGFQCHVAKPVDLPDLTSVIASLAGRTG